MAGKRTAAVEELPELLRHGGPPPIKNHTGGDVIRERHPVYEVALPGGVFRLVWDVVEARAKHNYKYKDTLPHVTEAWLDAVRAFREAAGEYVIEEDEDIIEEDDEVIDDDELLVDDDEIIEDDDEVLL